MREIKFRAFNGKEMITPTAVINGMAAINKPADDDRVMTDDEGVNYYCNWDMDVVTDYPLMQYTGLKDVNGIEVYEGDVVKVWQEDHAEGFQIGKVWWFDCYYPAFDIYTPNKKTGTGFESYSDEFNSFSCPDICFEVIGNIHENKELIK